MRKASKGRALVVGGSMSGLLAALLLRRAGWDVDVFERVESELAGRGAGIVAQPDLIATLGDNNYPLGAAETINHASANVVRLVEPRSRCSRRLHA